MLRNYPIMAHIRFILEAIRPEIRQYFFESEKDGLPFCRDKRAVVYQRAKLALDMRPFGTQYDVYASGSNGSTIRCRRPVGKEPFRITIGGPECTKPYSASVFNISAMSFGSLSANAIRALNSGAKNGGFAHDTGEGGYSPYHRENGGDIIWEIGSGYFGCRNPDGTFCAEKFAEQRQQRPDQDGRAQAQPGRQARPRRRAAGAKVSSGDRRDPRRADGRGLHLAVAPFGLLDADRDDAVHRRDARLSGGKPAGFKLCIGHPWEFLAICKAMLETGIYPDFIVVDGKEGGTGAAPLEFIDHIGMPLREGLYFVHNALVGINARERIKLGAAGKIISAFDIARVMALGADWCNAARGFMFAIGCIQSQTCHTDRCPTGVATQDRGRQRALVVPDKAERVSNFHRATHRGAGRTDRRGRASTIPPSSCRRISRAASRRTR